MHIPNELGQRFTQAFPRLEDNQLGLIRLVVGEGFLCRGGQDGINSDG